MIAAMVKVKPKLADSGLFFFKALKVMTVREIWTGLQTILCYVQAQSKTWMGLSMCIDCSV